MKRILYLIETINGYDMSTMKNILMVCYYYPPLTDVGCKRSVAFSKYFKKHGWNPIVLTVKNPDKTYCRIGHDAPPFGIHAEYSYSILNANWFLGKMKGLLSRLLKLFNLDLRRNYFHDLLNFPDLFWGWIPLSIIKGIRIIRDRNIDIIYVSCSPFSSAAIGAMLKLITGKPLVLDFRDPFALEVPPFFVSDAPKFQKRIERYMEEKFLKHSDVFIATTDEVRKCYIEEYPEIEKKIFAVHNGFDRENLTCRKRSKFGKFTIVYGGDLYFDFIKSVVFFTAIADLKETGQIHKETFQFLYYGQDEDKVKELSREYKIEDLVISSPWIPFEEMSNVISKSHFQLLRIVKPMISTKLYDGIALNTPFLATIPPGEAQEILLRYSPSSYVVTEQSGEKVSEAIVDAMAKYKTGEIKDNRVQEFLEVFSRESLTLKLMRIIDEILFPGMNSTFGEMKEDPRN